MTPALQSRKKTNDPRAGVIGCGVLLCVLLGCQIAVKTLAAVVIEGANVVGLETVPAVGKILAADIPTAIRPLGNPRVTGGGGWELENSEIVTVLDSKCRATAQSAVGADCCCLSVGLGLAAEAAQLLCCFVHGGGWIGLGDGDLDWLVLWLAGGQLAKHLPVLDGIGLSDVGSSRLAEDLNGLEQVGKTAVDVEGGNLVADVGGDGHLVWWVRGPFPADESNLPNRLGFARTIFNYFSRALLSPHNTPITDA